MRSRPALDRERGFTLLEVVVALAILGLALSSTLPGISSALRLGSSARDQRLALLWAQSKLDELSMPANLAAGESRGTAADGFVWRARVTPLETPGSNRPARDRLVSYQLEVVVERGPTSVRLVSAAAGRPS